MPRGLPRRAVPASQCGVCDSIAWSGIGGVARAFLLNAMLWLSKTAVIAGVTRSTVATFATSVQFVDERSCIYRRHHDLGGELALQ